MSTYFGVPITFPDDMSFTEAAEYINQEYAGMKEELGRIASIDITLDGEEVILTAKQKSPITRIRRITGYCSVISSFNDAKRAELRDRTAHIRV